MAPRRRFLGSALQRVDQPGKDEAVEGHHGVPIEVAGQTVRLEERGLLDARALGIGLDLELQPGAAGQLHLRPQTEEVRDLERLHAPEVDRIAHQQLPGPAAPAPHSGAADHAIHQAPQLPEEVARAYGQQHSYGPDYIIPAPFDPRLMEEVSAAVAKAAMDSGVAQKPIEDMDAYRQSLKARLNPTTSVLTLAYEGAKASPKRVVFAEGEEEVVLRAAIQFRDGGYGIPVLVGRQDVYDRLRALGVADPHSFEVHNSVNSPLVPKMVDALYERLQRRGYLRRDCERMVNRDRNIFGSLLLKMGEADAMITGMTRTYAQTMREVRKVIDQEPGRTNFGVHILVGQSHTVFMADTTVHERPSAIELADIAEGTAAVARRMGHEPRVAFLSYSTFGNPWGNWLENLREAVAILDERGVDFEYEGEMAPDVALNRNVMKNYPFCRLSGPANCLIMPGLQSANLSAKLLRELGGDSVIGPMLVGMEKPVQVATMASNASELLTLAVLAAGGIAG